MNFIFTDHLKAAENIVNGTGDSTTVKKMDLTTGVQILALPFISHVVWGYLFNLLVPQYPHLCNRDNNSTHPKLW